MSQIFTLDAPSTKWASRATITLFCLLPIQFANANVPAAYFACEGAESGDNCQLPGPRYGNCILDTLCEDPTNTEVNECLLCVDGCWGMSSGEFCIQSNGQDGICEAQDMCTTDPEKSFDQCNWCVAGDIKRVAPSTDAGCVSVSDRDALPLAFILLLAGIQWRRQRRP